MQKIPSPFSRLSRRLSVVLILACIGTLLFVFWAIAQAEQPKTPEELVRISLAHTLQSPLSYVSATTLNVAGKTLEYGTITGLQDDFGNEYLQGTILGDQIEQYDFGTATYLKDQLTGLWHQTTVRNIELPDAPQLSPLANFTVRQISKCEFADSSGPFYHKTYHVIGAMTPDNNWISDHFQKITYHLWINYKDSFVEKAIITAQTVYGDTVGILRIEMKLTKTNVQPLEKPLP